ETASACYRSGFGPFFSSQLEFIPDMMIWWGGGQVGFIHVNTRYFVSVPLTFVSTWDGDELSLVRIHHQLRKARRVDVAKKGNTLHQALCVAEAYGSQVRGAGLYQTLEVSGRVDEISALLSNEGFRVRGFPNGTIAFAPPLDLPKAEFQRLGTVLSRLK